MNKEIMVFLSFIILVLSIMPANALTINVDRETSQGNYIFVNKEKNSYEKVLDIYPTMTDSSYISYIDEKFKPAITETPDYFSWSDYEGKNWLTPVKRQLCGDCWDFAAIGALESIIKIRENCSDFNPDLSEQYVLSCLSGAGSCNGGSSFLAFKRIKETSEKGNNCNGVTLESCFPYQGTDDIACEEKCPDWEEKLIPILDYGQWNPSILSKGRGEIKTFIMQNGPAVAHIDATNFLKYWGSTHHNSDDYFPYTGPKLMINHVVVLVGWKDDENVRKGGYWICKNSWGTDWGYNGFFNIEYGSLNIDKSSIVWVDYDPDSYDWDPVASAGKNFEVDIGEEIIFDGANSTDADTEITSYLWDFGDETKSNDKIALHSYSNSGIYEVNLTVTDTSGNNDTDKTYVWVDEEANPPETPFINGSNNVIPKKEYTYTISTIDPDNDDIYYLIDGGQYHESNKWLGPYESGEEISFNKSWGFLGNDQIRVKAKDIYGLESDWEVLSINKKTIISQKLLFLKDFFNNLIKG